MTAFIASLLFVTLAEMGDKTQLLAMTFATRVPVKTVLADGFGIIIGIVLGKRIPDAVIRLVSAGIFIFFGLAGAATVLPAWLPLAGSTVVLFALTVVTLAAAHYLIIQRRRQDAQPQTPRAARGVLDRLSQSLFALLLLIGWVASLGLATPLAAYGHWITFVLLGGLGWKLIHGAVRSGRVPLRIRSPLIYIGIALKVLIEHLA